MCQQQTQQYIMHLGCSCFISYPLSFHQPILLIKALTSPRSLLIVIILLISFKMAATSSYTKPSPNFDLSSSSPVYKLNSGHTMPIIAYGTFRSAPGEVGPAVIEAIKAGYRHLDVSGELCSYIVPHTRILCLILYIKMNHSLHMYMETRRRLGRLSNRYSRRDW